MIFASFIWLPLLTRIQSRYVWDPEENRIFRQEPQMQTGHWGGFEVENPFLHKFIQKYIGYV